MTAHVRRRRPSTGRLHWSAGGRPRGCRWRHRACRVRQAVGRWLDALPSRGSSDRALKLRFSSALFVRRPFALSGEWVLADVPSKSRTLVAEVHGGDRPFVAASLVIPPGVAWVAQAMSHPWETLV